jgi:cytochrome bd-type quinol oxidase subunit 2
VNPVNQDEVDKSYAQNLWQLANIPTGFSAAQILIILLSSLTEGKTLRDAVNAHKPFSTFAVVFGQTILIWFVRWCNKHQLVLLGASASKEVRHTIKVISRIQYSVLVVVAVGFLIFVWNILDLKCPQASPHASSPTALEPTPAPSMSPQ